MLAMIFVMGVLMAVAPWYFVYQNQMNGMAALIISGFGVAVLIVVATVVMFTRLYRRAAANLAFVRTGSGGAKVIKDSGKFVVPVMHQVIPVSLETMRLNVERR